MASASDLNKVLRRGEARALELEPLLAEIVRQVLNDAADVAAYRFEQLNAPQLIASASSPSSTMIALKPRPEEAAALAHSGGEPAQVLHVTLAYLGDTEGPLLDLVDRLREVAAAHAPLAGEVGGVAAFKGNGDGQPGVLLPDVPGLVEVRQAACEAVTATPGLTYSTEHGYTAHTTVLYTETDGGATADGGEAARRSEARPRRLPDLHAEPDTAEAQAAGDGQRQDDGGLPGGVGGRARPAAVRGESPSASRVREQTLPERRAHAAAAAVTAPGDPQPDRPLLELRDAVRENGREGLGRLREVQPAVERPLQAEGVFPDQRALGLPLHFDTLCLVRGDRVLAELPFTGPATVTAAGTRGGRRREFCLPAELRRKTNPVRQAVIENVLGTTLAEYGIAFDVTNPFIAESLARVGTHIGYISTTTQLQVMDVIKASYENGLSIKDTARGIRKALRRISQSRAELIAQTELAGAVNGASLAAAKIVGEATGTTYWKEWLTAPGAKRPRHETYSGLNGQSVRMDDYFQVGTSQLLYPGDPSGPIHDIARCRCSIAYAERRRGRSRVAGGQGDPGVAAHPPILSPGRTYSDTRSQPGRTAAADPPGWHVPAGEEVLPVNCEAAEAVRPAQVTPAAKAPATEWTREQIEEPKPWVKPPAPKSTSLKKAGGYSSDSAFGTNTNMGDWAEDRFAEFTGGSKLVRQAGQTRRQFPFDVSTDGYLFEVKGVSTESSRLAAWPKPEEIAAKQAYAESVGMDAAIVMPVLDRDAGLVHYYWRAGVKGGRLSERTGWRYMGSQEVELWPQVIDEAEFVTAAPLEGDRILALLPPYSRTPIDELTIERAKTELRRLNRYNRSLKKRWARYEGGGRTHPGADIPDKIAASDARLAELRGFVSANKAANVVPYQRIRPQRRVSKIGPPLPVGDRYILAYNARGRLQAYDAITNSYIGKTYSRKWVAQEAVDKLNIDALGKRLPRPKPGQARFSVTTEDDKVYVVHAKDAENAKRRIREYTGTPVKDVRDLGFQREPVKRLPKPLPKPALPPRRVEAEYVPRAGQVSARGRDSYSKDKTIARLQQTYDAAARKKWTNDPFRKGAASQKAVDEVIAAGADFHKAVEARMRQLVKGKAPRFAWAAEVRQQAIKEVLAEIRDVGEGQWAGSATLIFKEGSKAHWHVRSAAEYLPTDWIVQFETQLRPFLTTYSERGGWNGLTGEFVVPNEEGKRIEVAVHELGHVAEDRVAYLRQLEQAYYERRTRGSELVPLRKVQPRAGFSEDEMARDGDFRTWFMGKDYGTGQYEIVAAGLQDLLFGRAARTYGAGKERKTFASESIWDADPEMANFILGLLALL